MKIGTGTPSRGDEGSILKKLVLIWKMTIAGFTLRFSHDVTVCFFFTPFCPGWVKKATSFFFSFALSDKLS